MSIALTSHYGNIKLWQLKGYHHLITVNWTNCLNGCYPLRLLTECSLTDTSMLQAPVGVHTLPHSEDTVIRAPSLTTPGVSMAYFHTLMTPSLDPVMTIHWEAWHRLMSLMISRCPWGGASGPLLGASSLVTGFFVYNSWITSTPSTSLALPMTIILNMSQIHSHQSWQIKDCLASSLYQNVRYWRKSANMHSHRISKLT